MIFRLSAAAFVAIAALTAYAVLADGADVVELAQWLRSHGHPGYAAWLAWVLLSPVVLAATALAVRRSPWPWVVAVTVQLASLVGAQARAGHLVNGWSWALVALALLLGLASLVAALGDRSGPPPEGLHS
ncbi:hypothetical protein [Nocardioides sp. cx-173]|uniref:hypothetical protein n=1 Tax=Nocardioides sp. cx-173 TaxID=2898796 RepID=UPI001E562496|nr:hypothetical protein [Nocardioides sp. cx-173]MCD4526833.1 hypothetical protein [Nocardioides sp. cx-173]UGB43934.1 hypothetical protein LQ940_10555 [Nocardioides sp. cx-173]